MCVVCCFRFLVAVETGSGSKGEPFPAIRRIAPELEAESLPVFRLWSNNVVLQFGHISQGVRGEGVRNISGGRKKCCAGRKKCSAGREKGCGGRKMAEFGLPCVARLALRLVLRSSKKGAPRRRGRGRRRASVEGFSVVTRWLALSLSKGRQPV